MDLRERPRELTSRHPWETARARFFCRVLAEHAGDQPLSVLDVGAGDGFVGSQLLDALPFGSSVTCFDALYTDEHLAELQASARSGLSFTRARPEHAFDVVVMLDVLEHVQDDRGLMRVLTEQSLRPGGLLLISVPAHEALYTQHDVALGHHRRYSASQLHAVLQAAGLQRRLAGSLFGSLLAPRAAGKLLELARGIRSTPAPAGLADEIATGLSAWGGGALVTGVVLAALELDAKLCALAARRGLPSAGLSVWALCERPR